MLSNFGQYHRSVLLIPHPCYSTHQAFASQHHNATPIASTSNRIKTNISSSNNANKNFLHHTMLLSLSTAAAFAAGSLLLPSTSPALAFSNQPPQPSVAAVPAVMESKQPLPSDLSPEELSMVKLFQENTPCVVNISNIIAARTPFSMDVLKLPQGQGSGFIWDHKGHIITNYHVIRGATEVRITLIDGSTYPAKLIGGDASKDIAVLQLDAPPAVLQNLKPVALGTSSSLFVGQKVLAIGNPFGLDHTLTSGIISGLNRELANGYHAGLRNVIQTDASINPGNSGGPLLDSRGRLIGINTAIADPSGKGASSGVGFALPIDSVKGLVSQILKHGRVIRPVLGVTIGPPQALRQLGLEGVLILEAPPGSPAAKAGMQGISRDSYGRLILGDVIVGLNGKAIKREVDLFDALDQCKVGEKAVVEVLRKGSIKLQFHVVLQERAPEPSD